MRKILVTAATILAATPTSALASDWYRVGLSARGVTYTDLESATREGPELQVWEYVIMFAPTDTDMTSAKSRISIRCQDRSYRVLYSITYLQNGNSDSWSNDDNARRFAAPDSNVENLILFHCGNMQRGTRLVGVTPEQDARRQPR